MLENNSADPQRQQSVSEKANSSLLGLLSGYENMNKPTALTTKLNSGRFAPTKYALLSRYPGTLLPVSLPQL